MDLTRRRFGQMLTALGLSPALSGFKAEGSTSGSSGGATDPQILRLSRNGWMPNNEHLPVLLYRRVLPTAGDDPAAHFESVFQGNGWPPQWRNGVYDFHHYHSTAHEVLGFAAGSARLLLGGPGGRQIEGRAGGAAVPPAGPGHCRLDASPDLLVVGGYPPDQQADLCRQEPTPEQRARIASL